MDYSDLPRLTNWSPDKIETVRDNWIDVINAAKAFNRQETMFQSRELIAFAKTMALLFSIPGTEEDLSTGAPEKTIERLTSDDGRLLRQDFLKYTYRRKDKNNEFNELLDKALVETEQFVGVHAYATMNLTVYCFVEALV